MVLNSLQQHLSSSWRCKFCHQAFAAWPELLNFLGAWMVLEYSRHLQLNSWCRAFWMVDSDFEVNRCNNWELSDVKCLVWFDGLDVNLRIWDCGGHLGGGLKDTSKYTWLIEGIYKESY